MARRARLEKQTKPEGKIEKSGGPFSMKILMTKDLMVFDLAEVELEEGGSCVYEKEKKKQKRKKRKGEQKKKKKIKKKKKKKKKKKEKKKKLQ